MAEQGQQNIADEQTMVHTRFHTLLTTGPFISF